MSEATRCIDVGSIEDVPVRGSRVVETPLGRIAVFRTADESVFAIDDRCPHLEGPLSDGIVHGHSVTCPLHNLVIDLETGKGKAPEGGCAVTYPVETREGRILLRVSTDRRTEVV